MHSCITLVHNRFPFAAVYITNPGPLLLLRSRQGSFWLAQLAIPHPIHQFTNSVVHVSLEQALFICRTRPSVSNIMRIGCRAHSAPTPGTAQSSGRSSTHTFALVYLAPPDDDMRTAPCPTPASRSQFPGGSEFWSLNVSL